MTDCLYPWWSGCLIGVSQTTTTPIDITPWSGTHNGGRARLAPCGVLIQAGVPHRSTQSREPELPHPHAAARLADMVPVLQDMGALDLHPSEPWRHSVGIAGTPMLTLEYQLLRVLDWRCATSMQRWTLMMMRGTGGGPIERKRTGRRLHLTLLKISSRGLFLRSKAHRLLSADPSDQWKKDKIYRYLLFCYGLSYFSTTVSYTDIILL